MLKKGFFYILFLLINFHRTDAQKCFHYQYDTASLDKDLSILKNAILQNHPSINFYGGYEFYYHYFDTALQIHQPMTEKDFRKLIKSKLNMLHCGHTNVLPSKNYIKALNKKKMKLIPYYITYDNGKLVVVKGFEKNDTLLHTFDTILEIDRQPAKEIVKNMKQFLYTDGFAEQAKNNIIQRHFTFYFSGIIEKDSFLITIKNKNGVFEKYINTREYLRVKNELMLMKTDSLIKKHSYYTGLFLNKQKNVYYMKIRAFGGIWMKRRFRKAFSEMRKNQTEYLILDLRDNPGGKITQSINLLSHLLPHKDTLFYQKVIYKIEEKKYIRKKMEYRIIDFFLRQRSKKTSNREYAEIFSVKKKNHFDGTVYVLVNANTFSAANLINVYLRKRPNTVIVGSESSGVKWGSNAVSFLYLYLPHTKIKVIIPTYRIIHNIKSANAEELLYPVKPDILVTYHTDDLLFKKDKEMEAVYHHIMKNIKK